VIRPATAADTPAIAGLIRALAEYERLTHEVDFDEATLGRNLFGPRPYAEVALCEHAGEVAGFALFFHEFSTFAGKPGLYLEDIFVLPDHRRHGHGRELLAYLARLAVERDCARLEWRVLDWNEPAIAFYRALGAEELADWTTYRLTGNALRELGGPASG
jgi:GNAT superfamily N-acetyltransferase